MTIFNHDAISDKMVQIHGNVFQSYVAIKFNILWPNEAMWCHRSWSASVKKMACCLRETPGTYVNEILLESQMFTLKKMCLIFFCKLEIFLCGL